MGIQYSDIEAREAVVYTAIMYLSEPKRGDVPICIPHGLG